MCELSTFLPPNSHLYSNILANCSMEFSHKSNMSLTLKAEFPITFATHLILSIDPNGPILIDKETDLIKFKISAVFENDSIHDLEEIHVSCSESPLTVNLLPYMTKFKELLRLKAIVLKEVESESLVISSMKLVVENILDLWSIQQCYRKERNTVNILSNHSLQDKIASLIQIRGFVFQEMFRLQRAPANPSSCTP